MTMPEEPKFLAAVDLLRRTGARSVQIRYSDDEEPMVWFLVVEYAQAWDTAAGRTPTEAAVRLCEHLVDGGKCAHCNRPTMFLDDIEPIFGDTEATRVVETHTCIVQWDPELATFRRSCEGDT